MLREHDREGLRKNNGSEMMDTNSLNTEMIKFLVQGSTPSRILNSGQHTPADYAKSNSSEIENMIVTNAMLSKLLSPPVMQPGSNLGLTDSIRIMTPSMAESGNVTGDAPSHRTRTLPNNNLQLFYQLS